MAWGGIRMTTKAEKPIPDDWPKNEWHWAEGNKYAMEGIKTLLYLNGGSAIALLTFTGTRDTVNLLAFYWLGLAVMGFGMGHCQRQSSSSVPIPPNSRTE
jgi:hypothetical protein